MESKTITIRMHVDHDPEVFGYRVFLGPDLPPGEGNDDGWGEGETLDEAIINALRRHVGLSATTAAAEINKELLAALEECHAFLVQLGYNSTGNTPEAHARAAIARAKGENR